MFAGMRPGHFARLWLRQSHVSQKRPSPLKKGGGGERILLLLRLTHGVPGATRHDGDEDPPLGPAPAGFVGCARSPNHVSRHLERSLDLSFVRDLVREASADIGRPSVDPVVFFTLPLILCFG